MQSRVALSLYLQLFRGAGRVVLPLHHAAFQVVPALDLGVRVQGSWFRGEGSGFRVQGSGFRVQGSGFGVQGSGFRVRGSGFGVQGSGFMV